MYYINNETYVCHISKIREVVGDILNRGFSKRDIVIVRDEGDFVILDGLEDEIKDLEFILKESTEVLDMSNNGKKSIVCFFKYEEMNNIVLSYYLKVARMIGVENPMGVVDMSYPELSSAVEVDETFILKEEDAKGIPINLLINSSHHGVDKSKFMKYFIDKVDSSKDKIVLTELQHIVKDNFMENKIDFMNNSDIFEKILELRDKKDLVIQDWHDLYALICVLSPPPSTIEEYYTISSHEVEELKFSTVGEMHLVNKLYETESSDSSFMGLYKSAVNDNCKYFRNLDIRTQFLYMD